MTNLEKLKLAFSEGLGMESAVVTDDLQYGNPGWDSVGHMALVAAIERAFDIMMETDDVIGMSSFAKAKEIVSQSMEPLSNLQGKVAFGHGFHAGYWLGHRPLLLAQHGGHRLVERPDRFRPAASPCPGEIKATCGTGGRSGIGLRCRIARFSQRMLRRDLQKI